MKLSKGFFPLKIVFKNTYATYVSKANKSTDLLSIQNF